MGKLRAVAGLAAVFASAAPVGAETFADAVSFLKKHTTVVVLADSTGARVAVCPDLQGRVMTSTSGGDAGPSFGWINRELLASGKKDPHFNAYGGEDRFWLGPEGGQFALFFAKGQPFDLAHWFTPAAIDTEPYPADGVSASQVSFRKKMALTNYSGAAFELELARDVRLVSEADTWKRVGVPAAAGTKVVAFESQNRIKNVGASPWKKETGLLSVWILGMFVPSPATTVVVPFKPGTEAEKGPKVNDAYFGKVPADRLVVRDAVLFFSGDGRHRSKIGIPPARAQSVLGSYDAKGHVLTLVQFTRPEGATEYVNSMWQIQDRPYGGDVVNSYNDGPPGPGQKPLGPFYELETSSPAAALAPGEALTHTHVTMHFSGDPKALDAIARKALGVGLADIESAFGGKTAASQPVSTQKPALQTLLARAGEYVADYDHTFRNLVAEEIYSQSANRVGMPAWDIDRRTTRADLVFVHLTGAIPWASFRDVYEVDGNKVRDRDQRLEKLFLHPSPDATEQVRDILRESARYNLGADRTANLPTLPLLFLHPKNQARFEFQLAGKTRIGSLEATQIDFDEVARPTLVTVRGGRDLPAYGRFWIDASTGVVVRSETRFRFKNRGANALIATDYTSDPQLGVWVPTEMTERYWGTPDFPRRTQTTARYSNFRRFTVTTDVDVVAAATP